MFSFIWMRRYSVGVEELDQQHQAIMKRLDELHEEMTNGKVNDAVAPLIGNLVSLAAEHFATEEKLMESIQFPGLQDHCAKHRELSQKVGEFITRHETGDRAAYAQFMYFVRGWMTTHMQKEDRQYARWLADQGIRESGCPSSR